MGRAAGITDEELVAIRASSPGRLFSEREAAALVYADAIVESHAVRDEVFAAVRRHFSEEEIIELTATITWEICAAKFNRALAI